MKIKHIGTGVLLTFVAVSVGYLVISEAQTGDGEQVTASADATPPATPVQDGQTGEDAPAPAVEDAGNGADDSPAADAPRTHKVIAYYFHNTKRCMTCNKIERLAEEALREQFAEPLETGVLEWRVVNMEEPPNTHFVHDYQLVASSLVIVDVHDGEQRDWTNMEKVWQYVHDDEAAFKRYVAEQTRTYLES